MSEHSPNELAYQVHIPPLLDKNLWYDQTNQHLRTLHKLFAKITGITGSERGEGFQHLVDKNKIAGISANHAAKCFGERENVRTVQFFRGIVQAVQDAQKRTPGKTIEILYAGTGPYATFLSLLAALFSPEEVQFTLIEINEISYHAAQKLIIGLRLSSYIKAFELADAIQYKVDENSNFDLLISETMNYGLWEEPLVPILLNLMPQLPEEIIVIPQNVYLDIALAKTTDLPSGSPSDLRYSNIPFPVWRERFFDMRTAVKERSSTLSVNDPFPSISFPVIALANYDFLAIYTEVQVYKEYFIHQMESDFSEPIIDKIEQKEKNKSSIEASYHLQPYPELFIKFV